MRTTGDPPGRWLPMLGVMMLAVPGAAEVEVPRIGQPDPFYGAAGRGVKVEATASPTDITPSDTIDYTLRVRGLLNADEVEAPDLAAIGTFARDFQIEAGPASPADPPGTREFRYRLRPRAATVDRIPEFVFPFYNPDIPQPPDRPGLPFQRARSAGIPIRVRPAEPPPEQVVPLDVPAFAQTLAGPRRSLPACAIWVAAVAPPVAALGGCLAWRIRNPNGARLARRRRSRATRQALNRLHTVTRHPPVDPAAVVGLVRSYLVDRYELDGQPHTPKDTAGLLTEAGASADAVAEVGWFLYLADTVRFAPDQPGSADVLAADAERLIRRLEGEP